MAASCLLASPEPLDAVDRGASATAIVPGLNVTTGRICYVQRPSALWLLQCIATYCKQGCTVQSFTGGTTLYCATCKT